MKEEARSKSFAFLGRKEAESGPKRVLSEQSSKSDGLQGDGGGRLPPLPPGRVSTSRGVNSVQK